MRRRQSLLCVSETLVLEDNSVLKKSQIFF